MRMNVLERTRKDRRGAAKYGNKVRARINDRDDSCGVDAASRGCSFSKGYQLLSCFDVARESSAPGIFNRSRRDFHFFTSTFSLLSKSVWLIVRPGSSYRETKEGSSGKIDIRILYQTSICSKGGKKGTFYKTYFDKRRYFLLKLVKLVKPIHFYVRIHGG